MEKRPSEEEILKLSGKTIEIKNYSGTTYPAKIIAIDYDIGITVKYTEKDGSHKFEAICVCGPSTEHFKTFCRTPKIWHENFMLYYNSFVEGHIDFTDPKYKQISNRYYGRHEDTPDTVLNTLTCPFSS